LSEHGRAAIKKINPVHGTGTYEYKRAKKKRLSNSLRLKIFERDNWTCGLCGKKVLRNVSVPNHLAATVDHIIPEFLGGSSEEANLQCAHFRCNAIKCAKPIGQMRLDIAI